MRYLRENREFKIVIILKWFLIFSFLLVYKSTISQNNNQKVENYFAFGELYGYTRYFYPDKKLKKINWEKFILKGLGKIENAKDNNELAICLNEIFKPIMPDLTLCNIQDTGTFFEKKINDNPNRVKFWYHKGYGDGKIIWSSKFTTWLVNLSENYKSKIISTRTNNRKWLKIDYPKKPYRAQLNKDIVAYIPIVLTSDNKLTTNKAIKKYTTDTIFDIMTDEKARLADIIIAWNIFQHFYPNFEVTTCNWDTIFIESLKECLSSRNDLDLFLILKKMTSNLNDGHLYVAYNKDIYCYEPKLLIKIIDNKFFVLYVGDSLKGKLPIGSEIKLINNKPPMFYYDSISALVSGATLAFKRETIEGLLLFGKKNTIIHLSIEINDELKDIDLIRDTKTEWYWGDLKDYPEIVKMKDSIYYINLEKITQKIFRDSLTKLENAKGVIFDLRFYSYHLSPQTIGYFINKPVKFSPIITPIIYYPDGLNKNTTAIIDTSSIMPQKPTFKGKIVFLAHSTSISQCETWLEPLKYYKIATIIGETSAGTDGDLNGISLPSGFYIPYTARKIYKLDGTLLQGKGIEPDIEAKISLKGIKEGKDEILDRAVEFINIGK